jgi:uncharacterized protein YndB with AHSA1/START domain
MDHDLTKTFTVGASAAEAFAAITDVRGWWSGEIEGRTDRLGEEFSYRVPGIHYSKFTITEFEPGKRLVWLVTESYLSFPEDKEEWTGTRVVFDLLEEKDRTRVQFTHEGLVPTVECYGACSVAWGEYILGSLKSLIVSGVGRPNGFEGEQALEAIRRDS